MGSFFFGSVLRLLCMYHGVMIGFRKKKNPRGENRGIYRTYVMCSRSCSVCFRVSRGVQVRRDRHREKTVRSGGHAKPHGGLNSSVYSSDKRLLGHGDTAKVSDAAAASPAPSRLRDSTYVCTNQGGAVIADRGVHRHPWMYIRSFPLGRGGEPVRKNLNFCD